MDYTIYTSLSTGEIAHRFRRNSTSVDTLALKKQSYRISLPEVFKGKITNKNKFSVYFLPKGKDYLFAFFPLLDVSISEAPLHKRRIDIRCRLGPWDKAKILIGMACLVFIVTGILNHIEEWIYILPVALGLFCLKDYIHKNKIEKEAIATTQRIIREVEEVAANITYKI